MKRIINKKLFFTMILLFFFHSLLFAEVDTNSGFFFKVGGTDWKSGAIENHSKLKNVNLKETLIIQQINNPLIFMFSGGATPSHFTPIHKSAMAPTVDLGFNFGSGSGTHKGTLSLKAMSTNFAPTLGSKFDSFQINDAASSTKTYLNINHVNSHSYSAFKQDRAILQYDHNFYLLSGSGSSFLDGLGLKVGLGAVGDGMKTNSTPIGFSKVEMVTCAAGSTCKTSSVDGHTTPFPQKIKYSDVVGYGLIGIAYDIPIASKHTIELAASYLHGQSESRNSASLFAINPFMLLFGINLPIPTKITDKSQNDVSGSIVNVAYSYKFGQNMGVKISGEHREMHYETKSTRTSVSGQERKQLGPLHGYSDRMTSAFIEFFVKF